MGTFLQIKRSQQVLQAPCFTQLCRAVLCRAARCLQVVGGSARSAATQLLHKVVQRQVLADWRLAVRADRALKLEVVRAWSAWVQEHQVRRGGGDRPGRRCCIGQGFEAEERGRVRDLCTTHHRSPLVSKS